MKLFLYTVRTILAVLAPTVLVHLFFEYGAEALGYNTHAEACDSPDDNSYAWRLENKKRQQTTHTPYGLQS